MSKHWTQTAKGKALLAQRKAMKYKLSSLAKPPKKETRTDGQEASIAYALGRVEEWLGIYADSIGVARSTVAYRVGELLHRKARRSRVGTGD